MMPQREIMKLVEGVFKGLWKRHVTNMGLMRAALLLGRRAGVAALGRQLDISTTPKHAIKRVDRFLGNPRFRLLDAWEALLPWVIGPDSLHLAIVGQRKRIELGIDWRRFGSLEPSDSGLILTRHSRNQSVECTILADGK